MGKPENDRNENPNEKRVYGDVAPYEKVKEEDTGSKKQVKKQTANLKFKISDHFHQFRASNL